MLCPNCKSHIDNNINFCNFCGMKLTNNEHASQYSYSKTYSDVQNDQAKYHEEQYKDSKNYSSVVKEYDEEHFDQFQYSSQYSNLSQKRVESEEDYLEAYIGTNYNAVKKGYFSIPSLIFGPLHLLYKRMYTQGILLLALISITYFYNSNFGFLLNVILNILLAFKFNTIYYESVIKRIDEIKISNPDKTSTELLEICKQKGKPFTALIAFIIFIISVLITMLPYLFLEEETEEKIIINDQIQELSYQLPNGFEHGEYDTENYKTYHNRNNNDCYITMESRQNTNFENYLKTIYPNTTLSEKNINNNIWITIEEDNKTHYFIEYNHYLYHIIYESDFNSSCKEQEKDFSSSLKFQ